MWVGYQIERVRTRRVCGVVRKHRGLGSSDFALIDPRRGGSSICSRNDRNHSFVRSDDTVKRSIGRKARPMIARGSALVARPSAQGSSVRDSFKKRQLGSAASLVDWRVWNPDAAAVMPAPSFIVRSARRGISSTTIAQVIQQSEKHKAHDA